MKKLRIPNLALALFGIMAAPVMAQSANDAMGIQNAVNDYLHAMNCVPWPAKQDQLLARMPEKGASNSSQGSRVVAFSKYSPDLIQAQPLKEVSNAKEVVSVFFVGSTPVSADDFLGRDTSNAYVYRLGPAKATDFDPVCNGYRPLNLKVSNLSASAPETMAKNAPRTSFVGFDLHIEGKKPEYLRSYIDAYRLARTQFHMALTLEQEGEKWKVASRTDYPIVKR